MLNATLSLYSILILSFLIPTFGHSQDIPRSENENSGIEIGVKVGTNGIHVFTKNKLQKTDNLKINSGVFLYQFRRPININLEEESKLQLQPNLLSFGLNLDLEKSIKPWLKVNLGTNVNLKQKWDLNLSTDRPIKLNGLSLTAEDFGQIDAHMRWLPVQPYLEIGLGKTNLTKRWNVHTNIGTRYMGSPKLNLQYEGFLETTTLNQRIPQIEKNMKNYSFYPSINVEITYKIASKRR